MKMKVEMLAAFLIAALLPEIAAVSTRHTANAAASSVFDRSLFGESVPMPDPTPPDPVPALAPNPPNPAPPMPDPLPPRLTVGNILPKSLAQFNEHVQPDGIEIASRLTGAELPSEAGDNPRTESE